MTPRFGIVGAKNTGKTTLVCALVRELTARGLRVATVKHAHHSFEIDHEGTDSFAHREAGAVQVVVAGSKRWAIIRELAAEQEPTLDELVARLDPVDLILIEGFKTGDHPKLELRMEGRTLAADRFRNVVTTAGDGQPYSRNDVVGIANMIVQRFELPARVRAPA